VLDFLGRPAPGESVELYNATELLALALTDSEGKALFIRLPPGTYTVKAGEAQAQVAVPRERHHPAPTAPLLARTRSLFCWRLSR